MVELVKRAESMIVAEHFLPSEQGYFCTGRPHLQACRVYGIGEGAGLALSGGRRGIEGGLHAHGNAVEKLAPSLHPC